MKAVFAVIFVIGLILMTGSSDLQAKDLKVTKVEALKIYNSTLDCPTMSAVWLPSGRMVVYYYDHEGNLLKKSKVYTIEG